MSRLILASKSQARQKILNDAGLLFETIPSDYAEDALKTSYQEKGIGLGETALQLAKEKAKVVSQHEKGFVVGADQILELDGQRFDKPKKRSIALERLSQLAGHTHYLHTALCVYYCGECRWHYQTKPALRMRALSKKQIVAYVDGAGPEILQTVGAYCLEDIGIRLFDKIDGDYFAILGLPIIPLLNFLHSAQELDF